TPQQISEFYSDYPRIHQESDLSGKCIDAIIANLTGQSVCDVGCGTGYLLNQINSTGTFESLVGVDFSKHAEWESLNTIEFLEHNILNLPFENKQFDAVVSTHTLEHILDIRAAVEELRRICKEKLIIVVPRERESIWSFNPHFHYFPYEHSFLKHLLPLPDQWQIKRIGRDYLYIENK
ncbi:MAG: class I SAM-dependent methyltransferase, partial [Planctomycetes bacterium]|nr:class I SAM-dependent methyltransferase [Planctomycetota bacterium]